MMAGMLMVALFLGQSAWGPLRMIAATVLVRDVLPSPATFDIVVMMVAMVIHSALSIVLAFVLALIIRNRSVGIAILIGPLFGLIIYGSSPNSGKSGQDLQNGIVVIAEAVGGALDDLDPVADALDQVGAQRPAAVRQDAGQVRFEPAHEDPSAAPARCPAPGVSSFASVGVPSFRCRRAIAASARP
jgi:hypothetical protein